MSEPLAYAAVAADSSESMYVSVYRDRVEQKCREHGWHLVPMYGSPPSNAWQLVHENERLRDEVFRLRLTDEEAAAIRLGEFAFPGLRVTDNGRWVDVWATLRGLIERHGPTGSGE